MLCSAIHRMCANKYENCFCNDEQIQEEERNRKWLSVRFVGSVRSGSAEMVQTRAATQLDDLSYISHMYCCPASNITFIYRGEGGPCQSPFFVYVKFNVGIGYRSVL